MAVKAKNKAVRPQLKKNMKFRTQFTDEPLRGSKEVFNKPSLTEPDNTMSIPEIIARYTRGQGIAVNQYPWQQGTAAEEGEGEQQDATVEQVLDIQAPAAPEPIQPAAAPVDQEPAAERAPAPAGA